jgi:hypothetical protein
MRLQLSHRVLIGCPGLGLLLLSNGLSLLVSHHNQLGYVLIGVFVQSGQHSLLVKQFLLL